MTENLLAQYITDKEAARQSGVCKRTLHRWHAQRKGPPRTVVGRRILYKRSSFDAWLASLEQSYADAAE